MEIRFNDQGKTVLVPTRDEIEDNFDWKIILWCLTENERQKFFEWCEWCATNLSPLSFKGERALYVFWSYIQEIEGQSLDHFEFLCYLDIIQFNAWYSD